MNQDFYAKIICVLAAAAALPSAGWTQTPQYSIFTIAGNGTNGYSGDGGPATQAELSNPCKVAADSSGNIYFADGTNARIRKIAGNNISTIAGNGTAGYTGDGGPATSANISLPCGVAVDPSGNVYFSQTDSINSAVRRAPASGNISTVTGTSSGAGFSGDGSTATNAQVNGPTGLALDGSGNLYIADTLNNRIRQITGNNIYTVAGNGVAQYSGDNGPAIRASLSGPQGVTVGPNGNLYIADTQNHCIRMVSGGVITTVAGTCTSGGFSGDNGPAVNAKLYYPKDVAVDAAGNLYIVDTYNFRIRMVTPGGTIVTIAGTGRSGYTGDNGLATNARLNFPQGIALGPNGTIFISDTGNNVIRLLTSSGSNLPSEVPPVISSVVSASACGGYSSVAPGSWIEIHGTNLAADTRTWTANDFQGNAAPVSLDGSSVSIGGQNAVVLYVSPSQVNAQVPLTTVPGQQQLTLTAPNGNSQTFTVTVNAAQPGLCQGATLAGNPYVAAVINGAGPTTYVLPSTANVNGVTFRPAHPGEVISFFGNGFGAVNPSPAQGQLVQQLNQLTTPLQVFFGQTQATVQYQGLAPGFIGLYQFNVVVPNIPTSDLVPVTFALGNFAGAPTLYTSVSQ